MTDQHPITPPPELIEQWFQDWDWRDDGPPCNEAVAIRAARWGADQELEACCEWFVRDWTDIETVDKLRAARRPKPKSLAEEALETLMQADGADHPVPVLVLPVDEAAKIRRALERLQELEGQG